MEDFRFQNITEIIFGKGTESLSGKEVKKYSTRILLHYGGDTIKKIGLYKKVIDSLTREGIEIFELPGVSPNPVLSLVKKGVELCREKNIDFILAVGGGSVIDSAKAIAIGVPYNGDIWDLFTAERKPDSAIPVGVILTVPAAGSEASDVSVITNQDTLLKKGFHSHLIRPRFAVLDPEVTYSIDPYQTACGAADTISHVLERYFTPTIKADLTDRLCEATIKSVIANVDIVLKDPKDYNSRAELMWASTVAHNGLLGTGRTEDWASHKLAHELSALYGTAHGASLSVIFPAWMRYVYKQDLKRFVQFAVRIWGVDSCFGVDEYIALKGIEKITGFFKDIGLPTSLTELGIGSDRFEEMAEKELEWGPLGNFMKLHKKDIVSIYELAV